MFTAAALFTILIKDVPEDLWEKRKEKNSSARAFFQSINH